MNEDLFNRWAPDYDDQIKEGEENFPFAGYSRIKELISCLISAGQEVEVLDLGVGTGLLTEKFDQGGARITGVDFSEKMLEKARARMPRARFFQQDLSRGLPPELTEERFDYILISYTLHHWEDWKKVELLGQWKNNLKNDGQIIIADIIFAGRGDWKKARKKAGDKWDDTEHYLIMEDLGFSLEQCGFSWSFFQVSFCGGILQLRPRGEVD